MNASLQHISVLAPWTTTAISQPKHPKTTVPYHFALPKYISNPFPTLGKHKKCINITVSIWRKDKKCINVTVSVWKLHKKPFPHSSPSGDCIKNHLYTRLRMETA